MLKAIYKHIRRTSAFELLQRRLTATAVQERWEAGKEVPGVGKFRRVDISLNRL